MGECDLNAKAKMRTISNGGEERKGDIVLVQQRRKEGLGILRTRDERESIASLSFVLHQRKNAIQFVPVTHWVLFIVPPFVILV